MRMLLTVLFALGFFVMTTILPTLSLAQQVNTDGPATQGTTTNTGFDWRWLLPLLAIPVLFFAFRDTSDEDYHRDRYMQGMKGGRSTRESEFGDDDDEEE